MFRHSFLLKSVVLLLAILSSVDIAAAESDATIRQLIGLVDSSRNPVEAANDFFKLLYTEGFTDEQIVADDDVPVDSVRQIVYYQAAEWHNDKQQYEQAKQCALKALPLYHGDSNAKTDCLNLLGVVYVRLGDFASGIKYAKECVDLDMRNGDNCNIASGLSTLAGTYLAADDADAALQYAMRGIDYAEKCQNTLRKTILMGMVSESAYKKGDFRKAVSYAREAFKIDSIAGRENRAAIRLSQEATALIGLGKYDEAKAVFSRAFPMLIHASNYHSLAIDYNQMGFMLLKQHLNREALSYFRKANELFDKMGDLYNQTHSYRGLYESYWTLDPDSARMALETFNQLKDSLYRQASADALARYKAEFETDRLIEEVDRHIKIRRWLIATGLSIILLTIAIIVLQHLRTRRFRNTIRQLIAEVEEWRNMPLENAEVSTNVPINDASENTVSDSNFKRILIDTILTSLPNGTYGVAQIATKLKMGEQTFRRRCVEATGRLPKAFIVAVQMERAMTLLKENKESTISQVANECGFDELSAFSRTFKRTFGCSPTDFRNNPS